MSFPRRRRRSCTCLPPLRCQNAMMRVRSGQAYIQTDISPTCLWGHNDWSTNIFEENARRTHACWKRIRQNLRELHDRQTLKLAFQDPDGKRPSKSRPYCTDARFGPSARTPTANSAPNSRVLIRIIGAQSTRPRNRVILHSRMSEIRTWN